MTCTETCTCCHGACCKDGTCSIMSCYDCDAIDGKWQGPKTSCADGGCPCNPPADHKACERCDNGSVSYKCESGKVCCNLIECCPGQCVECCVDSDCPPGKVCVNNICTEYGNCRDDSQCGYDRCCKAFTCELTPCPETHVDGWAWCSISGQPVSGRTVLFGQYNNGDDCTVGGPSPAPIFSVTKYWMVANSSPDEIQEAYPSPAYTYPVPGLSPPDGHTCRYVWRVWVGYGPQVGDSAYTPSYCEIKAYYLYIDVNRCAPTGGQLNAVADTSVSWPGWPGPVECSAPCDTDANGCLNTPPTAYVSFAP